MSAEQSAAESYLTAVIQLSLRSNRLAAYYASQSYNRLQYDKRPKTDLDDRCSRYRMLKCSLPGQDGSKDERFEVQAAYLLAACLAGMSMWSEALDVAFDGIKISRLATTMEEFEKLAEMCKGKLMALQRRKETAERLHYKLKPEKMTAADLGNRRDFALYQDREKSTAVRCMVDGHKSLDIDNIRQEISFIKAPSVRITGHTSKSSKPARAYKSSDGDGLASKLAKYRISDDWNGRRPSSIKPRNIDSAERDSQEGESIWQAPEKDHMKSMIVADVSENDVTEMMGERHLLASDITIDEKHLPSKQVSNNIRKSSLKRSTDGLGQTNFMQGQKFSDGQGTKQAFRSVNRPSIPEVKNNTAVKL